MLRRIFSIAVIAALATAPLAPAQAQFGGAKAVAVREGAIIPSGNATILVFRPDVAVGSQTTGGMNEPKADWTITARNNLQASLQKYAQTKGTRLVMVPEQEGEKGKLVADYTALFNVVAMAAIQHKLFPGDRLPTKKAAFDWTLGEEASRLRSLGGRYGLFIYSYDSYGSTGRKVLQVLGALTGMGLISAGVHIGYAGLVDLETGDLLWLNADTGINGDPRTYEGADKRVAQLLVGLPIVDAKRGDVIVGEEPAPAAAPTAKAPSK